MNITGDQTPRYGAVPTEGGDATWRYASCGSVPTVVAKPGTVAEVAQVVRAVADAKQALVPVGRGARLGVGNRPRSYDVALSTESLADVERHVAEDMTVTVQAGMILSDLNEVLAARGQWLPLDPAVGEETTIGGLIAADASGPLRNAYGKVRDFLLGVELVNGIGEIVRGGGRVVKNVAGYDVPRLLCGSYGTLGVIVSATFKTVPRPPRHKLFLWVCRDMADAAERAIGLRRQGIMAAFLEAMSEGACEGLGIECPAVLAIGVAGADSEVVAEGDRIRRYSDGSAKEWDADKAPGVVKAIRNFSMPISEEAVVARIAVLPGVLPGILERVESEAAVRGVVLEASAHAAVGVARCQILGAGDLNRTVLFAEWLRLLVRDRGGWVTYESMPDDLRGRLDAWGFSGPTVGLMRGIKRVFDPEGVLSPGRFVGGI